jgi:hypothetical protein
VLKRKMDEALHTKWDINLLSRNSAYKELINRKGIQVRSSHGIWFSYGLKPCISWNPVFFYQILNCHVDV